LEDALATMEKQFPVVTKSLLLSGCGMASSKMSHASASVRWTDTDVKIPDGFQQFLHRQVLVASPEFLVSLKLEYHFQVSGFHPVVKKVVVTDLLKSRRKYMHQIAADKLLVFQRYDALWLTGFYTPDRKCD
jgi:hypothetical protein